MDTTVNTCEPLGLASRGGGGTHARVFTLQIAYRRSMPLRITTLSLVASLTGLEQSHTQRRTVHERQQQ